MKKNLLLIIVLCSGLFSAAQQKSYKISVIAFYNLENFYDTVNNPIVNDEEFLPSGARNYNSSIYLDKVTKLATVISKIGTDDKPESLSSDGVAILGVAEVENDTVLTDLVNHPLLKKRNYKIVHYDSRDARGVDVGMLYNPKYFKVEDSKPLFVKLPGGSKDAYYTRDILWVKGKLDGETIHIYVNHWPSRYGGEERSAPAREAAALVCKKHIDSIAATDGEQKVIIMGDLNDDPINNSVTGVLKAKGKLKDVRKGGLYNPWTEMYKKGYGTLAYQDAWGLFDQIIISHPWLDKEQSGFYFFKQAIFNREFLTENKGRYKGYPMRTWDGNTYRGGYSDHYPTYLVFLKKN
ncbi:MAG: endonuclease/exonuclease/phosphatase [Chitinophagaceae bacterium]|nr:endonuclease/exonuclease/phosphatase [Chitinophagaceae bacterium]MCW5905925.1 endonuclease/exonuclease/phosphatase [Chitinophagaceae bacterium]